MSNKIKLILDCDLDAWLYFNCAKCKDKDCYNKIKIKESAHNGWIPTTTAEDIGYYDINKTEVNLRNKCKKINL